MTAAAPVGMDYAYDEHLQQRGPTLKGIIFVKNPLQTNTQKRLREALITDYTLCFILSYLPFSSAITFPSLIIWFIFSKKERNLTQPMSKPAGEDSGKGDRKMPHS